MGGQEAAQWGSSAAFQVNTGLGGAWLLPKVQVQARFSQMALLCSTLLLY